MMGSFFTSCIIFTLVEISLANGQQSRVARRLDSVEYKLDAVLIDMANFRSALNDINNPTSSPPSCSCSVSDDKATQKNVDFENQNRQSEPNTIVANSNSIQRLYKGFKDLKQAVLVPTETHMSQTQEVKEMLTEVKLKIEAIMRFNSKHEESLKLLMNQVRPLESEIKSLQPELDRTDKLYQLVVNMKTEIADMLRTTTTDMEQRLPVSCPRGWFQYLNYCYHLNNTKASWHEAIHFCKMEEAQLIEYDDTDEMNYIFRLVRSLSTWSSSDWVGFYIGGSDLHSEGQFVWESSQKPVPNINWLPGQPDNGGTMEHCMSTLVNQEGHWNDNKCDINLKFVCKKKLPDV